jgi:hypothetical protein
MSPVIEEARRRQRRRRLALAAAVLAAGGVAVAAIGLRQPDPTKERTSSAAGYDVQNGPSGIVVRGASADGRRGRAVVVVSRQDVTRSLRRGESITAELRRNPTTGVYEVRLTTSH